MRAIDISGRAHLWLRIGALAVIVGAAAIPSSRRTGRGPARAITPDTSLEARTTEGAVAAVRSTKPVDGTDRHGRVQVASVAALDLGAVP